MGEIGFAYPGTLGHPVLSSVSVPDALLTGETTSFKEMQKMVIENAKKHVGINTKILKKSEKPRKKETTEKIKRGRAPAGVGDPRD